MADLADTSEPGAIQPIEAAVVTISRSRGLDDDPAGDAIVAAFERREYGVATRELIPPAYDTVQSTVARLVDREDTDVVVTTGATGLAPDDVTVEAIEPLFGKRLPGFGELVRHRSFEEIGERIVGLRATAGVLRCVPIFCLPGSERAARLGATIVVEQCPHLVQLAGRERTGEERAGDTDGE